MWIICPCVCSSIITILVDVHAVSIWDLYIWWHRKHSICMNFVVSAHFYQQVLRAISCYGWGVWNSKIPVVCQFEISLKGGKNKIIWVDSLYSLLSMLVLWLCVCVCVLFQSIGNHCMFSCIVFGSIGWNIRLSSECKEVCITGIPKNLCCIGLLWPTPIQLYYSCFALVPTV